MVILPVRSCGQSAAFTRRTTGGGDFFRGDCGFTYSRLAPCAGEAANCGRSNSPTRPSPYIWSRPLLPRSVAEAARPRAASPAPVLSGVLRRDASSAETIGRDRRVADHRCADRAARPVFAAGGRLISVVNRWMLKRSARLSAADGVELNLYCRPDTGVFPARMPSLRQPPTRHV